MDEKLLTVKEMAEIFKVPTSWLYSRTRETGPGTIPRIKVGKYLRFEPDKVLDWVRKQSKPGY